MSLNILDNISQPFLIILLNQEIYKLVASTYITHLHHTIVIHKITSICTIQSAIKNHRCVWNLNGTQI